jgi:hypothetical protein
VNDEHQKPGAAFYGCAVVAGLFALVVLVAALGVLFGHIALPWRVPK